MPRPRAHARNKQGGKPAGQDTILIEKDNIILTTFIEKNRMVLAKDKVECILKCKILMKKV